MLLQFVLFGLTVAAAPDPVGHEKLSLDQFCMEELRALPGPTSTTDLTQACGKVRQLDGCTSVNGKPIFHFDKIGSNKNPKRILAKALIHGDETLAGVVARAWPSNLRRPRALTASDTTAPAAH